MPISLGGGVMSPQIRILPDTYTVTVLGAHLDQATVEVYSASKGLVSRGTNAQLDAEGAQLTFTLKLKEMYGDLEIRVLNYSNTAVAVQEITVDAYREAEVQE